MDRDRAQLIVGSSLLAALGAVAFAILSLGTSPGSSSGATGWSTYFDRRAGPDGGRSGLARRQGRRAGRDRHLRHARRAAPAGARGAPGRCATCRIASAATRSRAIGTIGLLGDRYVELSIGTSAGRVLEDGDELASVTPDRPLDGRGAGHRGARQRRHARGEPEPGGGELSRSNGRPAPGRRHGRGRQGRRGPRRRGARDPATARACSTA